MKENTLMLSRVRVAGGGDWGPAQVFTSHIAAALDNGQQTTLVMAGGIQLKVDMPLDKFMMRLKLDNPDT